MFDQTYLKVMESGLDAASLRQKVISNNLANIDTPGFKKSEVSFEDLLATSLNQGPELPLMVTDPRHIGNSAPEEVVPQVKVDESSSLRPDGNNVDIDQEMTEMAKNSIYYDSLVQQLSAQLGILRMVISEKP